MHLFLGTTGDDFRALTFPDEYTVGEAAQAAQAAWSGPKAPAWVASDSHQLAAQISEAFGGIQIRSAPDLDVRL